MARSDLLIQLVQSWTKGDKPLFKKVVEAIIAEERSKHHNVLADKLQENLNSLNYSNGSFINGSSKAYENRIENYVVETLPHINFEDLVLRTELEKICKDFIEEQLRADLLRSYNLEPRNRLLLIGPPGNGKTSLAEVIANSLMIPLLSVRYEGIIASYLGETSSRLKNLFEQVRTHRCVLFFDEFDSIGKERGDKHETGEIKRVVSSLLLQIDKLPSYVIVIAATNHPELLDRAVWRRFQVKATLGPPDLNQIEFFVSKFQAKHKISFGYSSNYIAQKLKGLSYSEIKDFCEDILRGYILSQSNSNKSLKEITKRRIDQLKIIH